MEWVMAACMTLATAGEIRSGCDSLWVDGGSARIEVFTYKPPNYDGGPLIVVCHGMLRNADEYRDAARRLADRLGALVAAPLFNEDDFPYDRYQAGGLLDNGQLAPRARWTWPLLLDVIEEVRRREHRPHLPYYFFGHSGGAQFLARMAGFVPTDAERIVVANAGAQLFPSHDLPYPYGFGNLPGEVSDDDALRRYLAQPLTLYAAADDCQRDEYLDVTETADRQGANRCERAKNCFDTARQLAEQKGWPFNWQLVTVPGVDHDHERMLDDDLCEVAFRGPVKTALRDRRAAAGDLSRGR
jgi:pimeloyl-ACP methyl ester carboxylesterase